MSQTAIQQSFEITQLDGEARTPAALDVSRNHAIAFGRHSRRDSRPFAERNAERFLTFFASLSAARSRARK